MAPAGTSSGLNSTGVALVLDLNPKSVSRGQRRGCRGIVVGWRINPLFGFGAEKREEK